MNSPYPLRSAVQGARVGDNISDGPMDIIEEKVLHVSDIAIRGTEFLSVELFRIVYHNEQGVGGC